MRIGIRVSRFPSVFCSGLSRVLMSAIVLASVAVGACGPEEDDADRECTEDFDCQANGFSEASCNEDGVCVDYSSGCDETQCHAGCTDGCEPQDADNTGDAADAGDVAVDGSLDAGGQDLAVACTESGGTVITASCCASAEPFPDLCAVGACGCAADSSTDTQTCDCGEGRCFDGTVCVDE